ncbi:MAG: pentapeptide repeat-containing protein [Candidatus Bathyarchaeia archaeon]|jgi:uncharacterized protein YjbI with pentapeptide repeats
MANPKHLELLEKGPSAVDEWQSNNKGKMLDFSYADLCEKNLVGFNLQNAYFFTADLSYANLSKTQLAKANFACSRLQGVDFTDANLSGACLCLSSLIYPIFSNTTLAKANLLGATLHAPFVKGPQISLKGARMQDTSLIESAQCQNFQNLIQ